MSLTYRSLDVIATFSPDHPTRTLQEISLESGLPLATTRRIVGDLVAWGALERARGGRLQVGLRLWEVASLAPRGLGLRELALPFMEDLYVATGENVLQLAVREECETVFVERLTGRHSVAVLTRVGDRFALHVTGVGLVLLAYAPAEVLQQVLSRPLKAWTEHTITDPDRLRAVLSNVRRAGVAVSDQQVTDDAVSVACPIRDARGEVIAALSLVVRHGTVSPIPLTPAVWAASRGISRALGARAQPGIPADGNQVVGSGRWYAEFMAPEALTTEAGHDHPPTFRTHTTAPRFIHRCRRHPGDCEDLPAPPEHQVGRRLGPRDH